MHCLPDKAKKISYISQRSLFLYFDDSIIFESKNIFCAPGIFIVHQAQGEKHKLKRYFASFYSQSEMTAFSVLLVTNDSG